MVDKDRARGGDFERCQVHALDALTPAIQAPFAIDGTRVSAGANMQDVLQPGDFLKAVHRLGVTEAELARDVRARSQDIAHIVKGNRVVIATGDIHNLLTCE